jgi:septal ring factor EnvC (AmiA/AmiB activator)
MDAKRLVAALAALPWLLVGCTPSVDEDEEMVVRRPSVPSYHTVRRGETVTSIARHYGVESSELMRDNRIAKPERLQAGQKLQVPGAKDKRQVPEGKTKSGAGVKKTDAELPVPTGPVKATGKFAWPVKGPIVRGYSGAARGIAIGASEGETVKAADGGRVVVASEAMRGFGKVVMLDHGNGFTTVYGNNDALLVREGEAVRQGQAIAKAGSTGRAARDQVEFRIYHQGAPVDPTRYLH